MAYQLIRSGRDDLLARQRRSPRQR